MLARSPVKAQRREAWGESLRDAVSSVVRCHVTQKHLCFFRHERSEGLPVPREPAYAAKRSQDGEAPVASE